MTTLVNLLLCIAALIVPGSALCNFPCEWIGKTFMLEDQLGQVDLASNLNITFSKFNSSEATTTILGFTLGLTCIKIDGNHLLLKWSTPEGDVYNCLTVKIVSPDVFTFVFREVERDDDFCNACYEANDKNANFGAARANGARDAADVITCVERPKICATYCKSLGQLEECRPHGYYHSRYQRPSYNKRKMRQYRKRY
ncbi:Hypothetical predicted protein [Mytilus galloprovincialis]|uniref:Uncharacterized protein n=1 Tax=Mytilus galloprovincialis TaxID=29158 RepID=A0A8B6FL11_MYTGA|nr:Hypothetical predicted protein [Mytilus galloprovincialis]